MKALVGAFNQEKALVGAFSVIVKTGCVTDGSSYSTSEGDEELPRQDLHPLYPAHQRARLHQHHEGERLQQQRGQDRQDAAGRHTPAIMAVRRRRRDTQTLHLILVSIILSKVSGIMPSNNFLEAKLNLEKPNNFIIRE